MTTESHFGFPVRISRCDPSLYRRAELERVVDQVLSMDAVVRRDRGGDYELHHGRSESSETIATLAPDRLPPAADLMDWIRSECQDMLGVERVVIDRSSINRMHYGSEMGFHQHLGIDVPGLEKTPDLVVVFYLVAPPLSADFVLAGESEFKRLVRSHRREELIFITPKEGQLVMHNPALWHAVSTHRSVTPRICFAFHVSAASPAA